MRKQWAKVEESFDLFDRCQEIRNTQGEIRMMSAAPWEFEKSYLLNSLEPETIELLRSFTVENPYETCFAFLWLLDKGSDLPWLVNMGCGVVNAAAQLLPWTRSANPSRLKDELETNEESDGFSETEDGRKDEEAETDGDEKSEHDLSFLSELRDKPLDWIEKEAELYRQIYTDTGMWPEPENVTEDMACRWNLPQLVYAYTGL